MKRALFGMLLLVGLSSRAFATTTDALQITSGGLTATIADNMSCSGTACGVSGISGDINVAAGTDTISGTINGWTLNIVSGTSHSAGLVPFGIDLTSLTASCTVSGGCTGLNDLHVIYSDINFNVPVAAGGFLTSYSDTQNGTGTTTESAYFDNSNTLFAEASLIGTVGPFSGTNHGSAVGGGPAGPNYSLTLDNTFSGGDTTSFSTAGSIAAVPEPASLTLVGFGLIGLAGMLRRRQTAH
jgi:hypothetical protein